MHFNKHKLQAGASILGLAITAGIGIAAWIAYEPDLPKIPPPDRALFSPALVRKGEQLATVGDCIVCHTADNGPALAGSRPLATPFGTLYSNNITPDPETGIGNWSADAFRRAMKEGVSRDGSHLYPALPYEHFTRVTNTDLDAIYAFLMSREPVNKSAPPNELIPGLGFRPLLAGWKFLFLRSEATVPDLQKSSEWNRGKYLVDGLAHCGGCHTPRNILGGEKWGNEFAGGVAEGWNAPPLNASNTSGDRWSVDTLQEYLKTGTAKGHSTAAGPMGPVTEGLSRLNDADVRAIAVYIDSTMHSGTVASSIATPRVVTETSDAGARLFEGACGGCHEPSTPMGVRGRPLLSDTSDMNSKDPRNAVQAVLQGIKDPTSDAPFMPSFADNLTNEQIADLLAYARSRFTAQPPWPRLEDTVRDIRKENAQ
ncbi:c-type cytochrome [Agrobacterium tumefaciens]|uniref:c-type cytochrome n=1 Tax=Agrobacterium tumefaciens TaxID=358 RepID=UPI00023A3169|nr:cytochrome c, class I [Agrobacterium tumefaciens 5A]